jgi:hypothetical protein
MYTVKRHFYEREKIMRIGQNRHLLTNLRDFYLCVYV